MCGVAPYGTIMKTIMTMMCHILVLIMSPDVFHDGPY
jgi:hypothetical protein